MKDKKEEAVFSKKQIITSMQFKGRADLLGALLLDGEMYSAKDVEAMLSKFLKGKVGSQWH